MTTPSTPINIVFGAMTLGVEGREQVRITSPDAAKEILELFASHGHHDIDTARVYGGGSSEEMLARIGAEAQGFKISTKVFATAHRPGSDGKGYTHTREGIPQALDESLAALQTKKVDIFYLHAPDRQVPFAETLEAIDKAYKAGKFERFGISNFRADEVEEIVALCEQHSWVKPAVYQGMYSAITRANEPELFPVLRKHSISFYAFSPLGGGFFTGSIPSPDAPVEAGSRFDPKRSQGALYRSRYYKDSYFSAMKDIEQIADKEGLTRAEIALRWISHHSLLKKEHGDSVLIGASSKKQLEANLADFEKGTLPSSVLDVLATAWDKVKADSPPYHH